MLRIAHRCGTDKFAQLSINSAKHSLGIGADYIELDVRLTKDNFLAINHDPDGMMLFDDPRVIRELTSDQFRNMKYKEAPELNGLFLEDFLKEGIKPLVIHVKDTGETMLNILISTLKKYNYIENVVLGITRIDDIYYAHKICNQVRILSFLKTEDSINLSLDSPAQIIRLWENWATKENIKRVQSTGKSCWIMTGKSGDNSVGITTKENLQKLIDLKPDGILLNNISLFISKHK